LLDNPDDTALDQLLRTAIDTVRQVMEAPQVHGRRPGPGLKAARPAAYWAYLAVARHMRLNASGPDPERAALELAEAIRQAVGAARGRGLSGGAREGVPAQGTHAEPLNDAQAQQLRDLAGRIADGTYFDDMDADLIGDHELMYSQSPSYRGGFQAFGAAYYDEVLRHEDPFEAALALTERFALPEGHALFWASVVETGAGGFRRQVTERLAAEIVVSGEYFENPQVAAIVHRTLLSQRDPYLIAYLEFGEGISAAFPEPHLLQRQDARRVIAEADRLARELDLTGAQARYWAGLFLQMDLGQSVDAGPSRLWADLRASVVEHDAFNEELRDATHRNLLSENIQYEMDYVSFGYAYRDVVGDDVVDLNVVDRLAAERSLPAYIPRYWAQRVADGAWQRHVDSRPPRLDGEISQGRDHFANPVVDSATLHRMLLSYEPYERRFTRFIEEYQREVVERQGPDPDTVEALRLDMGLQPGQADHWAQLVVGGRRVGESETAKAQMARQASVPPAVVDYETFVEDPDTSQEEVLDPSARTERRQSNLSGLPTYQSAETLLSYEASQALEVLAPLINIAEVRQYEEEVLARPEGALPDHLTRAADLVHSVIQAPLFPEWPGLAYRAEHPAEYWTFLAVAAFLQSNTGLPEAERERQARALAESIRAAAGLAAGEVGGGSRVSPTEPPAYETLSPQMEQPEAEASPVDVSLTQVLRRLYTGEPVFGTLTAAEAHTLHERLFAESRAYAADLTLFAWAFRADLTQQTDTAAQHVADLGLHPEMERQWTALLVEGQTRSWWRRIGEVTESMRSTSQLAWLRSGSQPLPQDHELTQLESVFYGGWPLSANLADLDGIHQSLLQDSVLYSTDYYLVADLVLTNLDVLVVEQEVAAFVEARGMHPDVAQYWVQGIRQSQWIEELNPLDEGPGLLHPQSRPLPNLLFGNPPPDYAQIEREPSPDYEEATDLGPLSAVFPAESLLAFEAELTQAADDRALDALLQSAVALVRSVVRAPLITERRPGAALKADNPRLYWTYVGIAQFLADNVGSPTREQDALRLVESVREITGMTPAPTRPARPSDYGPSAEGASETLAGPPADIRAREALRELERAVDVQGVLAFERELLADPDSSELNSLARQAVDIVRGVMQAPQVFGPRPGPGLRAHDPTSYWAYLEVARFLRENASSPTRREDARRLANLIRVVAERPSATGLAGGTPPQVSPSTQATLEDRLYRRGRVFDDTSQVDAVHERLSRESARYVRDLTEFAQRYPNPTWEQELAFAAHRGLDSSVTRTWTFLIARSGWEAEVAAWRTEGPRDVLADTTAADIPDDMSDADSFRTANLDTESNMSWTSEQLHDVFEAVQEAGGFESDSSDDSAVDSDDASDDTANSDTGSNMSGTSERLRYVFEAVQEAGGFESDSSDDSAVDSDDSADDSAVDSSDDSSDEDDALVHSAHGQPEAAARRAMVMSRYGHRQRVFDRAHLHNVETHTWLLADHYYAARFAEFIAHFRHVADAGAQAAREIRDSVVRDLGVTEDIANFWVNEVRQEPLLARQTENQLYGGGSPLMSHPMGRDRLHDLLLRRSARYRTDYARFVHHLRLRVVEQDSRSRDITDALEVGDELGVPEDAVTHWAMLYSTASVHLLGGPLPATFPYTSDAERELYAQAPITTEPHMARGLHNEFLAESPQYASDFYVAQALLNGDVSSDHAEGRVADFVADRGLHPMVAEFWRWLTMPLESSAAQIELPPVYLDQFEPAVRDALISLDNAVSRSALVQLAEELADDPHDTILDGLLQEAARLLSAVIPLPRIDGARPDASYRSAHPVEFWALLAVTDSLRRNEDSPYRQQHAVRLAENILRHIEMPADLLSYGDLQILDSFADHVDTDRVLALEREIQENPEDEELDGLLREAVVEVSMVMETAPVFGRPGPVLKSVEPASYWAFLSVAQFLRDNAGADDLSDRAAQLAEIIRQRTGKERAGGLYGGTRQEYEETAGTEAPRVASEQESVEFSPDERILSTLTPGVEPELTQAEWLELLELVKYVGISWGDGSEVGTRAEGWLIERGRPVWQGGVILPEAARVLMPLARALANSDTERLGGADVKGIASRIFLRTMLHAGEGLVRSWLEEAGARVLPEPVVQAAKTLSAVRGRHTSELNIADLTRQMFPGIGEPNLEDRYTITGILEAAGFGMWTNTPPGRMMVTLAVMFQSQRDGFPVHLDSVIRDVLEKEYGGGKNRRRIKAWTDATLYLDSLPGRSSEYTTFVNSVVVQARRLQQDDGTIDLAKLAGQVFAEPMATTDPPKVEQRAALRFWLTNAGLADDLVDSALSTERTRSRAFMSPVASGVVKTIGALTRSAPPAVPQPNKAMTWRDRGNYALWKASQLTTEGTWFSSRELAQDALAKQRLSRDQIYTVQGFLDVGGLGAFADDADDLAPALEVAFQEARQALANGERIDVDTVRQRLQRDGTSYPTNRIWSWLVATGLLGGRIDPAGVIGQLRSTVRALAEEDRTAGREPDAADLVRRALGDPFPTPAQLVVVKEWIAEEPWKVSAAGRARQAEREGKELDFQAVAREVFETDSPQPEDIRRIVDLLDEHELLPSDPTRASDGERSDPLASQSRDVEQNLTVVGAPYVGDFEPSAPQPTASVQEQADFVVEYALWSMRQRVSVNVAQLTTKLHGRNGTTKERHVVEGIVEAFGVAGPAAQMLSGGSYSDMRQVLALVREDQAAKRKVQPYSYASRLFPPEAGPRPERVKGWTIASIALANLPRDGARQKMVDRAVKLAADMLDSNEGVVDIGQIARDVFRTGRETTHQRYLIKSWLRASDPQLEDLGGSAGMDTGETETSVLVDPGVSTRTDTGATDTPAAQLRAAYEDVLRRYPQPPIDLDAFESLDVRDPRLMPLDQLERGLLPALAHYAESQVNAGASLGAVAEEIAPSLRGLPEYLQGFTHRIMLQYQPRYRFQFELMLATIEDAGQQGADVFAELESFAATTYLDQSVTDMWLQHYGEVLTLRAAFQHLSPTVSNALHQQASAILNARVAGLEIGPATPAVRLLAEERLLRVSRALLEHGVQAAVEMASSIARELNQPIQLRQVGGSGGGYIGSFEEYLRELEHPGILFEDPFSSDAAEPSAAAFRPGPVSEDISRGFDFDEPVNQAEVEEVASGADRFQELSGPELVLYFELLSHLESAPPSGLPGIQTAEAWLEARRMTVWDADTGALLPDMVRLLKPLVNRLAEPQVARIGGVDAASVAARLFEHSRAAQGAELIALWLAEAGIGLLASPLARAGEALAVIRTLRNPTVKTLISELALTAPKAMTTFSTVSGYLDAAGQGKHVHLTRDQMVVAIAAQLAAQQSPHLVNEDHIVADVLLRPTRYGYDIARIHAWRDTTLYLDAAGSKPSYYRAFVERAVEVARALAESDGSVDVARVAARVFGEGVGVFATVSRPSAEERAAVRFWLEQAGMVRLVDSVDADAPRSVRVFPPRSGGLGARILLLAGDLRPSPPEQAGRTKWREVTELVVWRVAGIVSRSERFTMDQVMELAHDVESVVTRAIVSGVLEAAGLGSYLGPRPERTASRMTAVLAEARRVRAAGEKLDASEIAGSGYSEWAARGWFLAFGFMGGPIEANSVLGLLRGAVRAMAE
ncbi:hypothetical protein, partial [Streptomyces sp. NPDC058548]